MSKFANLETTAKKTKKLANQLKFATTNVETKKLAKLIEDLASLIEATNQELTQRIG